MQQAPGSLPEAPGWARKAPPQSPENSGQSVESSRPACTGVCSALSWGPSQWLGVPVLAQSLHFQGQILIPAPAPLSAPLTRPCWEPGFSQDPRLRLESPPPMLTKDMDQGLPSGTRKVPFKVLPKNSGLLLASLEYIPGPPS